MDIFHVARSLDLMIQLHVIRLKMLPSIEDNSKLYQNDTKAPARLRRAKIEDLGIIED